MKPVAIYILDNIATGDTKGENMKFFDVLCYTLKNNHGIIGSLITAGATIGSSLLSGKSGRDAQEEANKLTRELYYADREWNKPINQVARLREAGLNPNLVYGGSGVIAGNTSKGAPKMESIGGYDVDFAGAVNAALTYGALKKQREENKNIQETNENLRTTRKEIMERVRGLELDNELKKHDLSVIKDTPTTSKDHGFGSAFTRGAIYLGRKVAEKSNSSDFLRAASNLLIPQEMRGGEKKVDVVPKSNRPWFMKLNGKPWFMRHR